MIGLVIFLGVFFGNALNFFIYRIPREIKIYQGLPTCGFCNRKKKWYEYIPLLGFLFNRCCPKCHQVKRIRELIIPLFNTLLYVVFYLLFTEWYFIICGFILSSLLIVMMFIDGDYYIIPDRIHVVILVLSIFCLVWEFVQEVNVLSISPIERGLGFFGMGGILLLVGFLVSKKVGKDALGGGDVKLMACLGFFAGIKLIFLGLFFGAFIAGISMPIIKRHNEAGAFAFGPFLAVGVLLAIFFGNNILDWYVGLFV